MEALPGVELHIPVSCQWGGWSSASVQLNFQGQDAGLDAFGTGVDASPHVQHHFACEEDA